MLGKTKPKKKSKAKSQSRSTLTQADLLSYYGRPHGNTASSSSASQELETLDLLRKSVEAIDFEELDDVPSPPPDLIETEPNAASRLSDANPNASGTKGKGRSIFDMPIPKPPPPLGPSSRPPTRGEVIVIDDKSSPPLDSYTILSQPSSTNRPKVTHPFFQLHASARNAPSVAINAEATTSRQEPIIIHDESPPPPPTKSSTCLVMQAKPTHKATSEPQSHEIICWPGETSQHVRGRQSLLQPGHSPFPKRSRPQRLTDTAAGLKWPLLPTKDNAPFTVREKHIRVINMDAFRPTIPTSHLSHPAISRTLSVASSGVEVERSSEDRSNESWCERWKPRLAAEVLGNETQATYLRSWLQSLALAVDTHNEGVPENDDRNLPVRGTKRPAAVHAAEQKRRRKRQRGRDLLDDIDDAYLSALTSDDSETDSQNPAGSQDEPSTPFANAILLHGGSGVGKTSAVYACAYELGWDVHEVYPGIGKRTGASLNAIVDGVGKNHVLGHVEGRKGTGISTRSRIAPNPSTVISTPQDPTDLRMTTASATIATRKKQQRNISSTVATGIPTTRSSSPPRDESEDQPIDQDNSDDVTQAPSPEHPISPINVDEDDNRHTALAIDKPRVRQSIILLEEVDILFKEDVNFWPAVVALIRDSRRPVVLTCNDVSLIPTPDVPFQALLEFKPCDSTLAATYLQCICLAEQHQVCRECAEHLYNSTYELLDVDMPDQPSVPYPHNTSPAPDLRRALNQAQFWCSAENDDCREAPACCGLTSQRGSVNSPGLVDWARPLHDTSQTVAAMGHDSEARQLRRLSRLLDMVSSGNAYLDRREKDVLEETSIDRCSATLDDEMGHATLLKEVPNSTDRLPGWCSDRAIAKFTSQQVQRLSQGVGAVEGVYFNHRRLWQQRRDYQLQVVQFLDPLIPLNAPLLPRPEQYLDYIPWIQAMVQTDDECLEQEGRLNMVKRTRSGRAVKWGGMAYERYLTLEDNAILAARASTLRSCWRHGREGRDP